MRRAGWLFVAPALFAGCLFRNTSAPPRFFAPGSAAAVGEADDPEAAGSTGVPIQLRAVHGTGFLRERIVWRISPVEYGQYEERLWCELPATYVQRALAAELRRAPGLRLTSDVRAPALRVEVLAFDEVLAPRHAATVSLAASLRDGDGDQLVGRTFTAAAPIAGDDPAMMAEAMGRALDEATTAVVTAVAAAVHAH
jgi:ABC-type uncharacterized transport system auxiliary subunit